MVKTIIVLEDGKMTHQIDENDWDGVEVKDGKLVSKSETYSTGDGMDGASGQAQTAMGSAPGTGQTVMNNVPGVEQTEAAMGSMSGTAQASMGNTSGMGQTVMPRQAQTVMGSALGTAQTGMGNAPGMTYPAMGSASGQTHPAMGSTPGQAAMGSMPEMAHTAMGSVPGMAYPAMGSVSGISQTAIGSTPGMEQTAMGNVPGAEKTEMGMGSAPRQTQSASAMGSTPVQATMGSMYGMRQTAMGSEPGQTQAAMGSVPGQTQAAMGSMHGMGQTAMGSASGQTQVAMGSVPGQTQAAMGSTPETAQSAMVGDPGITRTVVEGTAGIGRPAYEWRETPASEAKKADSTKRQWFDLRKALSIILIIFLSATAGFGGGLAAGGFGAAQPVLSGAGQSFTITPTEQISTTEAVAAKVIPSVVGITSKATVEFNTYFFGTYSQEVGGVGTGIIVDEGGYILTNSHVVVVEGGVVDNITVLLPDSREVEGRVLWQDEALDLAIVKIEATDLTAANLGDSDTVKIGSYAAAIGNPMGLDFRGSVSQGVVSGLDRTITVGDGNGGNGRQIQMEGLLQVDAAINSGNSGGPLLNQKGEVIGINTAKAEGADGMGFAIPINVAKPIVESIKATGEFHRVYIGIQPGNVTDLIQAYPHLELGVDKGAMAVAVTPGSPAEKAGIKEKDIITHLDGKEIKSSGDLIKQLLGYKSGDVVKLTIVRDKAPLTIELALTDSLAE